MRNLIISPKIQAKISQPDHGALTREEVEQCFLNHDGGYVTDEREEHRTDPPTLWFVGETNRRKPLKVVFVLADGMIYLKSCYPATSEIQRIYRRLMCR